MPLGRIKRTTELLGANRSQRNCYYIEWLCRRKRFWRFRLLSHYSSVVQELAGSRRHPILAALGMELYGTRCWRDGYSKRKANWV